MTVLTNYNLFISDREEVPKHLKDMSSTGKTGHSLVHKKSAIVSSC